MHAPETAAITDIASTEHAIARLDGPERHALRRLVLLTAATKGTALVELAFATPNTLAVIAPFNSAPTHALELVLAST